MAYPCRVKIPMVLAFLLAGGLIAPAQTNDIDWSDVMDSVQQFAQANLDEDVFKALQDVDREKVVEFLNHYQDSLRGDYVLDVGQLQAAAQIVLPLLDAQAETRPYASWLRSRLDYFAVAAELKSLAPLSKAEPGQPAPRLPNPTFQAEQEIWIRKVAPRPWPKGAAGVVPELKTVFEAEGVPAALVWVAEVESGFDAAACSPVGAVGQFQLMPATAKEFGLRLWPRDQRRQLAPSARAAARDLRQLHGQFGDWRLALAAFNAGAGTVQHLLQRYHAESYERIAVHLPAETQMYVPKVEATIRHREGLELEQLPGPSPTRR